MEMISTLTRRQVFDAINDERQYQMAKYGVDKQQSIPGFILVMQRELQEAIDGWMSSCDTGRDSCLHEILQVVATGVACLEKYGTVGYAISTDDHQSTKSADTP